MAPRLGPVTHSTRRPSGASWRRAAALPAVLATLVVAACGDDGSDVEATGVPTGPPPAGAAGVQMFQWTWPSIAQECTDTLGPLGYRYVVTSPPQEHVLGPQWWTAYQPVSYQVESRLGTREEFADMVATCRDAGVSVVADAVINHMTGQDEPGTGWAGSEYEHYEYPGLYDDGDFHHCGLAPGDDIADYGDAEQVQTCELLNLADLDTSSPQVRETIVAYLEDLLALGVAGFRIDAAKHMAAEDVEAIVAQLPEGTLVWQEVIRGAGEPIQPEDYLEAGDVYEFAYGEILKDMGLGSLGLFEELATGQTPGLVESSSAITFVNNHDTERNGTMLTYEQGARYALANVLMLAAPYGLPLVYSGYAFDSLDGYDAGPQQDAVGAVLDAVCSADAGPDVLLEDGDWVCQHRWPQIAPMVAFRSAAGEAELTDWQQDGPVAAFGREDRGFVVVNQAADPVSATWSTSLEPGDYCDVQTGALVDGACTGSVVTVAADGSITATVPGRSALAVHVDARPTA